MSLEEDDRLDHVVVGYSERSVDTFPTSEGTTSKSAIVGPIGEEAVAVVCCFSGSADRATCRIAVYSNEDGPNKVVHAVTVKLPSEALVDARVTHMASQVDSRSGGVTFCLLTSTSVLLSLYVPPRSSRSDPVWTNRLASVSQRVTTVAGLTGPATSLTLLGPGWAAIGCADGNVTLAWLSGCENGLETPSLCEKNLGLVAKKSVWSKMTGLFRSSRTPTTLSAAVVGLVPLPNQELLSVTADGCCRRWSEPLTGYAGIPPASEANLEVFGGIVVSNFDGDELPGSVAVGRQDLTGGWVVSMLYVDEDESITEGPSIDVPLQAGSEIVHLCIGNEQLVVIARSPEGETEILVGDISPEDGGDGALAGFTACATVYQQRRRKLELARGVGLADLEDLRAAYEGNEKSEICSLLPSPPCPLFYVADGCTASISSREFVASWWAWTLTSLGVEEAPEALYVKLAGEKSPQAAHSMGRNLLVGMGDAIDEPRSAVGVIGDTFVVSAPNSVSVLNPIDDIFTESVLRFGMGHTLACGGAEDLLLADREASDVQKLCSAALMAGACTIKDSISMVLAATGEIGEVVEGCAKSLRLDDTSFRMVMDASNQIGHLKEAARELRELIRTSKNVPNEILAGVAVWTSWALSIDSGCGVTVLEEIRALRDEVLQRLPASLLLELAADTFFPSSEGQTKQELLKQLVEYPVNAKEVLVPLAVLLHLDEGGEDYVKARCILADPDNCTSERFAYVLDLLKGVCVHGSLPTLFSSIGDSLPQHCTKICCQAGFFEAEIAFAKLQGVDPSDLFDRALELRDWDTCLEALAQEGPGTSQRMLAMTREVERCGALGWLMKVKTGDKTSTASATAGKLLDVVVASARPESLRELQQLWGVITKSADRQHAARLALRGYLDNGGSLATPEPAVGLVAADCTTPFGELPVELRQPELYDLPEITEPEVVLSTLDRLQSQKRCLLLAKASLKRMKSPQGVFIALRKDEDAQQGARFLFVDLAWVQLRIAYTSLYYAVVELTRVSIGAVDAWRLCRIGSSLGLLKPAVELARLAGFDEWSSCYLPFVELIRRAEAPALSREDGQPSLMKYAYTRFDSAAPLQCDGNVTEALWTTLLLSAEANRNVLSHVLVYLLRVEKSAVPERLVDQLNNLDWLTLLRVYMVTDQLEEAAELAVQSIDDWEPQSSNSPLDLALILQLMEAVDAAVENGDGYLVPQRDALADALEGLRDELRVADERANAVQLQNRDDMLSNKTEETNIFSSAIQVLVDWATLSLYCRQWFMTAEGHDESFARTEEAPRLMIDCLHRQFISADLCLMLTTYIVQSLLFVAFAGAPGSAIYRLWSLGPHGTCKHTTVNSGKPLCTTSVGAQSFGYVTVSDDTKYFYALINADDRADNTPTFVFLPGGPGTSATGLPLTMMGPCYISRDGKTLNTNEYSWTKKANGIFIDAPGGTGFSTGRYEANMDKFVDNMWGYSSSKSDYMTLLEIIKREPHVKDNLRLVGFSFDGSTATLLAKKIVSLKGENKINLKMLLILSGSMGPLDMYRGAVEMAKKRKLLSSDVIGKMTTDGYTCAERLKRCQPTSSRPYPDPGGDCHLSPPGEYLNRRDVQDAMGTHKYWIPNDPQVFSAFERYGAYDTTAVVSELLDSGLQVRVVNGDQDFVCNTIGAYYWTTNLKGRADYGRILAAVKPKTLKFKRGGPLGTIRKAAYPSGGSLALIEVLNGGHVFTLNKPLEMQQAIEQFFAE
ncbi:hypothetical protein FOL47_006552 [Perkinsus chesapeaki]|uniref:Uncharacterized protein n=1 Tax=Perkinsus chesapeaki TaxID=330153 RepID=A0A7J6LR00_PERCH|nr:hypothetical protein FOL47_006552 [Perkinsus chesapeaki]